MIRTTIAATAVAMFAALPAVAGTVAPPVIAPAPTMPAPAPSTDWTGFFVGLNGGVWTTGGPVTWTAGAHAGYLHDSGDFVFGGEVSANYVGGPGMTEVAADAILGFDAGRVMPHVTFGGTYFFGPNDYGVSAGAGLSVKASDNIIITGRYRYNYVPVPAVSVHQGILAISYQF